MCRKERNELQTWTDWHNYTVEFIYFLCHVYVHHVPVQLIAFLPPWCVGYWHGRRCFQYLPNEWRCLGQIIISLTSDSEGDWKIPARIRISSYSVILSLDKWQVFKWEVIESLHSPRRKRSDRPLEFPQLPLYLDECDKKHNIAMFTNQTWKHKYLDCLVFTKFDWQYK